MLQPKIEDGRFVNPGPIARIAPPWGGEIGAEPAFRDFWRWQRSRTKHPGTWNVARRESRPLGPPPASGIAATWIGHSSVVLQIDGLTLLCDPVWSKRLVSGLVVPRYTQPGLLWEHLPAIDAVLISHDHYDHLDAPTIQRIPRHTPIVCGLGVGAWFRARGFANVAELGWWDATKLGEHTITFVPAQHFSGRTPWGRDRTLWGGHVIEGPAGSVAYFAGDSGYFSGFKEIGEHFPKIDLCLMPIGAYVPRWFMSPVHVDPDEAGQAFLDCGAHVMLPIHWGVFRLADEPIDEPPRALRRWWEKQALAPERLRVAALGETVRI